jgi:hypothetical protein
MKCLTLRSRRENWEDVDDINFVRSMVQMALQDDKDADWVPDAKPFVRKVVSNHQIEFLTSLPHSQDVQRNISRA